jgi:hypothetical protein
MQLKSPLAGVPDGAWEKFVKALEVQPIKAVSESGGLGSYDLRPRRLVELGFAKNLRSKRTDKGRQVYECDLAAPMTSDRFLKDPIVQYNVLAKSIAKYAEDLDRGAIKKPDVSKAGALAILHVGGRGALQSWPELFENTRAVYEAAQGAF